MLKLLISIFLCLIIFTISPLYDVNAAFLYKKYVIRKDNGLDVLCDSYIIQKNDWVFKLFSQKGEISQKNFPEFLRIFKRINPHIHNANKILPGQHIFVPLRILKQDSMLGQSSGIVTIPFVTISSVPEILKNYSTEYTVKEGECLSRLIVQGYRTDEATTELYREGIKLFGLINPGIVDSNLIHAGQKIYIPNSLIRNQPWYQSLFDPFGNIVAKILSDDTVSSYAKNEIKTKSIEKENDITQSPFKKLVYALDAKLLNKGTYYFPMQAEEDFGLDLSKFPVIELANQSKIIFQEDDIQGYALNAIRSFWKNVIIIPFSQKSSSEQLFDLTINSVFKDNIKNKLSFSDQGIKINLTAKWIGEIPLVTENGTYSVCINFIANPDERTPDSMCRYLKSQGVIVKDIIKNGKITGKYIKKDVNCRESNQKTSFIKSRESKIIVNDLLEAMSYRYDQDINFTFPYKGIQIEALSNLISLKDQTPLIVDFGNIYGEAVSAIKKAGMEMIRIDTKDNVNTIIQKLLKDIGLDYTINPIFFIAKRPEEYNTSLSIPGFLVADSDNHNILISTVPLHNDLIQFLRDKHLKIVIVQPQKY